MTAHLLLVMLGPVQEFIAQARRTRDLWFGSHLLSELSRRAARAMVDGGAQLVFPALTKGHPEIEPCSGPLREDRPPLNIANKLLAEVPAGIAPEHVFFELTLQDKLRRIADQRCEVFIDDLPELLAEPHFPSAARAILFDPDGHYPGGLWNGRTFERYASWAEAADTLLGPEA